MTIRGWQWVGWMLFSVSAIGFVVASWRAGDVIALLGAAAFMAANGAFMVAHHREGARHD